MFQQSSGVSNNKCGGISRTVHALGTVIGIGAAILVTPLVFRHTRERLLAYLMDAWGERAGELLTWAFCGVEALTIYFLLKLAFTGCAVWCLAAFAAKRL